jgi:hypothetical protein
MFILKADVNFYVAQAASRAQAAGGGDEFNFSSFGTVADDRRGVAGLGNDGSSHRSR